jgi:hypothetical protein
MRFYSNTYVFITGEKTLLIRFKFKVNTIFQSNKNWSLDYYFKSEFTNIFNRIIIQNLTHNKFNNIFYKLIEKFE